MTKHAVCYMLTSSRLRKREPLIALASHQDGPYFCIRGTPPWGRENSTGGLLGSVDKAIRCNSSLMQFTILTHTRHNTKHSLCYIIKGVHGGSVGKATKQGASPPSLPQFTKRSHTKNLQHAASGTHACTNTPISHIPECTHICTHTHIHS